MAGLVAVLVVLENKGGPKGFANGFATAPVVAVIEMALDGGGGPKGFAGELVAPLPKTRELLLGPG